MKLDPLSNLSQINDDLLLQEDIFRIFEEEGYFYTLKDEKFSLDDLIFYIGYRNKQFSNKYVLKYLRQ